MRCDIKDQLINDKGNNKYMPSMNDWLRASPWIFGIILYGFLIIQCITKG